MGWTAGSVNVNPPVNTVLADTGQLASGIYDARIIVSSTQPIQVVLELRNAANSANVSSQQLWSPGQGTESGWLYDLAVDTNQRLRVRSNTTMATSAGTVQVSIFTRPRPALLA